jgi:hypothetical protein
MGRHGRSQALAETWGNPFNCACVEPWRARGGKSARIPHEIKRIDGRPLAMAGLCETWKSKDESETITSYTIVITEPNKFMAEIHDRMPVILEREDYEAWLTVDIEDFAGASLSIDGEQVSFSATIDGKPQRFCIDPCQAFSMGAWLIPAFKTSAHMLQIPEERRFTLEVEQLLNNHIARTMEVIEKHLNEDFPKPAKKEVGTLGNKGETGVRGWKN